MSSILIFLYSLLIGIISYSGISLVLFHVPYNLNIESFIVIITIFIFIFINLNTPYLWSSRTKESLRSIRYFQIFLVTSFCYFKASAICYFFTKNLLNIDIFFNLATLTQKILIITIPLLLNTGLVILSYFRE